MAHPKADGQVRLSNRQLRILAAVEAYWRVFESAPRLAELERFLNAGCAGSIAHLRWQGLLARGDEHYRPGLRLTPAGIRELYPILGRPTEVSHVA